MKLSFVTTSNFDRTSVKTSKFAVVSLLGVGSQLLNI